MRFVGVEIFLLGFLRPKVYAKEPAITCALTKEIELRIVFFPIANFKDLGIALWSHL